MWFLLERFPLPLGTWDGLRYFIVALPEPSIELFYSENDLSSVMIKPDFAYAKTKTQISFAVTAKLISAFVFTPQIVQSFYFPYLKFQASSNLLWLYSQVCVRPGQKPLRQVLS